MSNSHLGDGLFKAEGVNADPSKSGGVESPRPDAPRHRLPASGVPATRAQRREQDQSARRARTDHTRPRSSGDGRGRRSPLLPLVLALLLVIGAGGLAVKTLGIGMPSLGGGDSGGDYAGQGSGQAEVTVAQGDSGMAIGATLQKAGVVKSSRTFAEAFSSDPDAARIQPGTYALRKEMSAVAALDLMQQPGSRTGLGVTVPEGLWASEIYARLAKATSTPLADYRKVKPSDLGLPAGANGKVEGYLFPSRYEFQPKATATEQLRQMVTTFKNQTRGLDIDADKLNRVVTIASIVQAESRLGSDGPKVARVVENRLKTNGETVGRLQMDSTIHYITQKRGSVSTDERDRKGSSPYNTYQQKGLPPGPINNPGLEAIKAAQNPVPGPWFFFVTVNQDTGETRFATTYEEQKRNEVLFRQWCQSNPGKC